MADKTNYVYYYSDPEGTTRNQRYHMFTTDVELDTIPWHFHKEAPSEDLKSPVWSKEAGTWVEDDKSSNAAQLATVSEMVDQLQKDHEESVKQNTEVGTTLKSVQEAQAQQTQMMSQMMMMISQSAATAQTAKTAETAPTADEKEAK